MRVLIVEDDKSQAYLLRRLLSEDGYAIDVAMTGEEARVLAAANEYEYFAQGYEAFISERKRPSAGLTGRHTNHELLMRDPELYRFLVRLTGRSPAIKGPRIPGKREQV